MKKIILLIIIVLELSLIKIPEYIELNDLAIIEEITIISNNNQYIINLKEIIPIKDDAGIDYEYKYYKKTGTNIKKIIMEIDNETKKKLYLNKVKSLTTNIINSNKILNDLNIKPKVINHLNNNYSIFEHWNPFPSKYAETTSIAPI